MKKRILTGDRPTGPLHLGHYIGSLKNRVHLQKDYDQYVMIADVQALTDNFDNPLKIRTCVQEVAKDYLSVGLDPDQSTLFIQSQIPQIAELTLYFMNLVSLGRLERNPTVKSEMKQKGFGESIPAGFFCYPVNQAADITLFQAQVVPVGDDQVPMIEQTNEIVRKFNRIYHTDLLKECSALLSQTPRLIGIDGQAKASKSLGNAISLSDSPKEMKEKVFQMYTDPDHLRVSDPGKVEGHVVFAYLDAFDPNKEEVEALKAHYKKGGLGDMILKKRLFSILEELMTPLYEKRLSLRTEDINEVLVQGTQKAYCQAEAMMKQLREVIGVQYFD